jgi:hypothetical protein
MFERPHIYIKIETMLEANVKKQRMNNISEDYYQGLWELEKEIITGLLP